MFSSEFVFPNYHTILVWEDGESLWPDLEVTAEASREGLLNAEQPQAKDFHLPAR